MEDQVCKVLEQVETDIEERWSPKGWGTARESFPDGTMCLIHSVQYRATGTHTSLTPMNSLYNAVMGELRSTLYIRGRFSLSIGVFNDHHSIDEVKRLVVETKQRVCK